MSDFTIDIVKINNSIESMNLCGSNLNSIQGKILTVKSSLNGALPFRQNLIISKHLERVAGNVGEISRNTVAASNVLAASRQLYISADQKAAGNHTVRKRAAQSSKSFSPQVQTSLIDAFQNEYGLKDFIKGFGNIGKGVANVISIFSADSWKDYIKIGVGTVTSIYKIGVDFGHYRKISRAIGVKNAISSFLKKEMGLSKVGHASTFDKVSSKFSANLSNSTSPYNLRDAFSSFTGEKGVGKAVASWAGVAVSGMINGFSNYEEYKAGKISKKRAVAETVTETAVDTIIATAATPVVGAAIAAVTGTIAAPVVVAVATGVGLAALNAGVKHFTGKSTTELISDAVLDTGKGLWTGAKKAAKAVGGWYDKLKKKKP